MRHRVKKAYLSRNAGERRALYRNLITDLLRHERITTTEAKAKAVKPQAERIISMACRSLQGDSADQVAARREVLRTVTDKTVTGKLFDELAKDFADRPGGYTRIVHLGPRRGDGARMVILELVG